MRHLKVLLENYKLSQGIRELYRIVGQDEVEYIENFNEYKEGLLVYSRLFYNGEKDFAETNVYHNGRIFSRSLEEIQAIDVYIDSIRKKKDVALKKTILKAMKYEGKIAWGILTGIRPTKIVHRLLDQGLDLGEIRRVLGQEYLLREDRMELLLDIVQRQRAYLRESRGKYSIYVGIPFCPSRCLYCSFPAFSIEASRDYVASYVDSLIYEIRESSKFLDLEKINTIYIGGGTPTSLEIGQLERIIRELRRIFGPAIQEFTVEAGRPDTLNYDYLKMLKENGVDRISINPQTMNDRTLEIIGRDHTSREVINIYRMAQELGIDHINMDLIVGLPHEGYEDVKNTLRELEALEPDNLTIHSLAVKTGSKFSRVLGDYDMISDREAERISSLIADYTRKMKLEPYYLYRQKQIAGNLENIGYSRSGDFCKYNISMMEERETVLGFGLGSVSKILGEGSIERLPNFRGLKDYLERVDELVEKKRKYLSSL